jgi:hypothetical protein
MIEQKFQQDGLLAATNSDSTCTEDADLILVYFPSPGLFVKHSVSIPKEFKPETSTYYLENANSFNAMYVFLPAVLKSQFDAGKTSYGLVYEKDVLKFEPSLMQALKAQSPKVIEHRSS